MLYTYTETVLVLFKNAADLIRGTYFTLFANIEKHST